MDGINPDIIARRLMDKKVPGCMGEPKWTVDTIMGILQNEKHMGDAILQKTFTADYLTKKQVKNEGQLAQYHVKDDHEAIVSKELWQVTQLEIQRRKDYIKRYGLRTMGRNTDEQPFTNRVFCGVCGELASFGGERFTALTEILRLGCAPAAVKASRSRDVSTILYWRRICTKRS